MILVDSSVWIDYFRNAPTVAVDMLDALLGKRAIITGDLIMLEVLQGTDSERDFAKAREIMQRALAIEIGGVAIAIEAARNYRHLRAKGFTVRKTIDTIIATRCIVDGYELLHNDRDFDPFAEHLGLKVVELD